MVKLRHIPNWLRFNLAILIEMLFAGSQVIDVLKNLDYQDAPFAATFSESTFLF